MPIQITCTGCQSKLKAPDTAAGKKIKCPKCQTVVPVPAGGGDAAAVAKSSSSTADAVAKSKPESWYLQTPDGSQYGPVSRGELDEWFAEGRVSPECQLLKEGTVQWQWATEVFPNLSQIAAAPSQLGNPSSASAAPSTSPLTPLSPAPASSEPFGLTPLGTTDLAPLGNNPGTSTSPLPSYTSGAAPLQSSSFGSPGLSSPGLSSPGLGSPNSYASSSAGSYGAYGGYQQRSGPHPMVIVAGILHIVMGCWNAFNCLLGTIGAMALLALGGAVGAAGAMNENPEAQGAMAVVGTLGVAGAIMVFIFAILFLVYGVMQVITAVGLFQRKQWARTASFVFASMGIVASLFYLAAIVLAFDITSIIGLMGELVYVPILFIAMCLPDATRDFR